VENSNLEEHRPPVLTMADNRTMAELLCAPTEGYAEAIVVPLILAEQFELKHSLINMMTTDQFFRLKKDNMHDYIRWRQLAGKKYSRCVNDYRKKSKVRNSRSRSLVSQVKACDENSNFEIAKLTHAVNQQTSVVTTAMMAMLKQFQATPPPAPVKAVEETCVTCGDAHPYYQCPAAGGNTFLEFGDNIQGYVSASVVNYNQEIAKLTHAVNQQTSVVTTAMTANLKQFQATPPPAFVKSIEETCVTCGGAHPYYQCLATGMANQIRPPGFGQLNVQNNQNRFGQPQGFNCGNNFNPGQSYQAPTQQNQIVPLNELEKVKRMNEANMKAMQTQINIVKNELRNEMKNSIQASLSNQTNEIKNTMASLFQMNSASTSGSRSLPSNTVTNLKGKLKAITTRSGLVLDGPTAPTHPPFINLKEDERVEETLTDPDLSEYTIKVPPPPVQKYKPPSQSEYVVYQKDPLYLNIPYPSRMRKQKQQEKDEV
nr:hypothetical protein [Tanacetum cinerariifolium]